MRMFGQRLGRTMSRNARIPPSTTAAPRVSQSAAEAAHASNRSIHSGHRPPKPMTSKMAKVSRNNVWRVER